MNLTLPEDFFLSVFHTRCPETAVVLEDSLVKYAGGWSVLGVDQIDLDRYQELGLCQTQLMLSPRPTAKSYCGGEDYDKLYSSESNAVWKIDWQDSVLFMIVATWQSSCGMDQQTWVVGETSDLVQAFILDVERKTNDPGQSILVFRNGHWDNSQALFRMVQASSFDDLIMEPELIEAIRGDFRQFLDSRDQYLELGVPWRRGALLIGPPGNGKTHCVRALVKEMSVPCLYVQSLADPHLDREQLLGAVFRRARQLRPCVLIMEDLDALVGKDNQSFFLNQMDGFEKNEGLIVLATTNHPERIDPAILNRPSRFDRKYHFDLPNANGRRRFLDQWRVRLADKVVWKEASLNATVESTHGYSFAYLKELMISSLTVSLSDGSGQFESILVKQLQLLTGQMKTDVQQR